MNRWLSLVSEDPIIVANRGLIIIISLRINGSTLTKCSVRDRIVKEQPLASLPIAILFMVYFGIVQKIIVTKYRPK